MPDDINGVRPADAAALYAIAEDACARLAACDPDDVFAVVKALDLAVGTDWGPTGATMTYVRPSEIFRDSASFQAGLAARTREAQVTAFAALAVLREEAAGALFGRALDLDLTSSYQVSFEANLHRAMWARWKELAKWAPREKFGEMFLRGKFSFEALTDEQVAAIPEAQLLEGLAGNALPYPGERDAERLLALHPALSTLDQRGAVAPAVARSKGHFARSLFRPLIASLIEARHPSAEAAVLARVERDGADDAQTLGLLIAIDHRPTLERVFAGFAAAAQRPLPWDPHHVDRELAPAIRAGFALDPKASAPRFGAWFDPKAVRDDRGAKVAHDVWMVGRGRIVDHGGTRLATGEGPVIAADPSWAPIAAKLAHHPRLGQAARWVVSVTAEHPRKLIEAEALPESAWLAPKVAKKASALKKKVSIAKKRPSIAKKSAKKRAKR